MNPLIGFQLQTPTTPAAAFPRREFTVSSVAIDPGDTRLTQGAGEDAQYLDLLSKVIIFDVGGTKVVRTAKITVAKSKEHLLSWIDDVYSFVAKSKTDAAMDILLGHFNALLMRSEFELCDSALRSLDFKRLDVTTMVTVLSITRPASSHLKARVEVVRDIEKALHERVPERANRLLQNLR